MKRKIKSNNSNNSRKYILGTNAPNSDKCNKKKNEAKIGSLKNENNLEECRKKDAGIIKGTF